MGWKPFRISKPRDITAPGVSQARTDYSDKKAEANAQAEAEAARTADTIATVKKDNKLKARKAKGSAAYQRKKLGKGAAVNKKRRSSARQASILITEDRLG